MPPYAATPADWSAADASALLTPVRVGDLELRNRMVMAPLTRCRATADHVPTPLMVEYYSQRAGAGLAITEATVAAPNGSVFHTEGGCYTEEQAAGWKRVTDAVHAKGGRIFVQLYHGGRATIAANNGGAQPVAPSAIRVTLPAANSGDFNATGEKAPYEDPRELSDAEIPGLVRAFVDAARLAVGTAGFDGVEIHAANGYLIDQFLRDGSNKRAAPYGGSLANRARFLLEVVDGAAAAIGAARVGVRLSPLNSYQSATDSDPEGLTAFVAAELEKRKIAFVHLIRIDFFGIQKGDVWTAARKAFSGPLLVNGGFSIPEAAKALREKTADAIVFGTKYLANPDLDARVAQLAPLTEADAVTFYKRTAEGYTDYPFLTSA